MMSLLRWMRRRKKCCCAICCGGVLFVIMSIFSFGYHLYKSEQCTDIESKKMITDLCKLYVDRKVDGSLCSALCDTGDIRYETCTNYKRGKKVLFMTCKHCVPGKTSVPVVFKMKSELEERDTFDLTLNEVGSREQRFADYKREIENFVRNTYTYLYHKDMSDHKDILSFSWGWNFDEYVEKNKQYEDAITVAGSSIWSLVQQQEYVLYKDLHEYSFIPKIYGSCGPAYFVEKTPTLGRYEFEILTRLLHSWRERASIAVKLIDLMLQLDDIGQPFHLCDIKADNFGLRDNGEVTLVDIDCAMFEKNLINHLNYTNCTTHDDCDFFDCRSFCDTKRGKCVLKRTNNNLQSLCEDVFVGYFPKVPTGLLRDPPGHIKVEVFRLLEECSYPSEEATRHNVRDPARTETVKALRELLLQSIQEQ